MRRQRGQNASFIQSLQQGEKEEWLMERIEERRKRRSNNAAEAASAAQLLEQDLKAEQPLDGRSLIHVAAERGCSKLVVLVAEIIGPDIQDSLGRTPLMVSVISHQLPAVTSLLSARAALEAQDQAGKRALHHAVGPSPASALIVTHLVTMKAAINIRDNFGISPLDIAAAFGDSALESAKALIKGGAAVVTMNRAGLLPVEVAGASRRVLPSQGPEDASSHSTMPRWDGLGTTPLKQLLLLEDRRSRREFLPGVLGRGEKDRLRAGLPLFC